MRSEALLLAIAGFSLACAKPTEPIVCTAIAVDALVVTVVDASTGQRICDAKVVAVDGAFSEELRRFGAPDCTYSGATERRGVYEIRATKAGYEPAVQSGIRVTADVCHVIPAQVILQLKKSS